MNVHRVSIDEHLPPPTEDSPGIGGKVRNLSALKAVAIGLDQVVNRCQADLCKWGHIDPGTAAANKADFDEARKQLRVLEIGLEAGRGMITALEAQLAPPKPVPPPKDKPAK